MTAITNLEMPITLLAFKKVRDRRFYIFLMSILLSLLTYSGEIAAANQQQSKFNHNKTGFFFKRRTRSD